MLKLLIVCLFTHTYSVLLVACFPVLGTWCWLFPHAWHLLPVFPRFAVIAGSTALGTGCLFSVLGTRCLCFELGIGWLFSCTCHWLPVFKHLALMACFSKHTLFWFWIFRSGQKPDLAMRMFMHTEDRIRMCVICMCNFQTFQSAPPAP